jgi:hypothetical protein
LKERFFSSGSEPYEDQMERICNEFKQKQHDERKVSTRNVDKDITRGVVKAGMKGNHMLLRNRGSKLKNSLKPPAIVGNVNDIDEDASERLVEQDEDVSENLVEQDEDASERSVEQDEYASESLDEQEEVEQDEVEQKVGELQGDSLVSDYDRFNESNESLELHDAQSLGAGSDNDLDDDTEGYVPLPMSEEQLAEQLSEQRDNGDYE